MKKCFALLLTLLLALGLTATAFAVEGETPTRPRITVDGQTYEDITEVPITKLYQLVNDGTVSPAETFRFSIAADSVTDSAITAAADMPVFTPSTFDIAFSEGAATAAGASGSFALPLPEFSSVGIYTYKITESAGSTAGVTYNGQALYLKITVLQPEGEGKVRVAAVHLGSADGSKQDNILNTYSAGTLNVTKTSTWDGKADGAPQSPLAVFCISGFWLQTHHSVIAVSHSHKKLEPNILNFLC